MSGLFVPGWGADPALYQSGLPHGWAALRPPGYRRTGASSTSTPAGSRTSSSGIRAR